MARKDIEITVTYRASAWGGKWKWQALQSGYVRRYGSSSTRLAAIIRGHWAASRIRAEQRNLNRTYSREV